MYTAKLPNHFSLVREWHDLITAPLASKHGLDLDVLRTQLDARPDLAAIAVATQQEKERPCPTLIVALRVRASLPRDNEPKWTPELFEIHNTIYAVTEPLEFYCGFAGKWPPATDADLAGFNTHVALGLRKRATEHWQTCAMLRHIILPGRTVPQNQGDWQRGKLDGPHPAPKRKRPMVWKNGDCWMM